MESKEELSSNVCPICQKEVEILNDDLCFSMRLHMWTHKPLEIINQEVEEQLKKEHFESKNMNTVKNSFCLEYQSNDRSSNNDLMSNNKSKQNSASPIEINKTSKKRSTNIEPCPIQQTMPFSPLEELFSSIESKLHREFFSETSDGIALCKICNVTVQPMIKVNEHLKTKLHENNTIQYLTNLLPVGVHHVMEYVSFYCSTLFCRLCGFKIYSCSTNPNEAINSIILHNLSKGHMARDQSNSRSKQGLIIVESLAKVNPTISNNRHLLEVQTKTEFRCMLCDKVVGRNLNEKELNIQLNKHFLSRPHLESLAYAELAAFDKRPDIEGKKRHNFILADCKLFCTICEMFVEPKVEALISHVTQSLHHEGLLHSVEVNIPTTSCLSTTSNQTTVPNIVAQETTKLSSLLNSLPEQLRNTDCIVENAIGETICLICDIKYPPPSSHNLFNIRTHLLGRKHKNKAKRTKWTSKAKSEDNLGQQISTSSNEEKTFMQHISQEEFHCDVCNINVPFMEGHHKEARHMNLVLIELSKTDMAIKSCIGNVVVIKNDL